MSRTIEQKRAACNKSAKKRRESNPNWWEKKKELEDRYDLKGMKFGYWDVIRREDNRSQSSYWLCRCECGNEKIIAANSLRLGMSKSCGCKKGTLISKNRTRHGDVNSKEYGAWSMIKGRCYNPKNNRYKSYGARGIKMCDRWLNSYSNFLEDMGRCPSIELSLDRINNDLNYCKDNCRWATDYEQMNNTTRNTHIEYKGERLTVSQWAKKINLPNWHFYKKKG